MNNYQVLHYHFTVPLKRLSFLEVSTTEYLIDDIKISPIEKEQLTNDLSSLFNFIKKKNNALAYFSTSFLEILASELPTTLDKIKQHVKSGQIELVASCAYHSLSFLCHPELFKKEVEFHKSTYKKHFNKASKLFINTAGLFNDQLVERINNLSFKGLIAPSNSWHLDGLKSEDFYQSTGDKLMKILLANGDSTNSSFISLVNGFGSEYDKKEFLQSDLKALNKLLGSKSVKEIYSASMPLSSSEWSHPMTHYLASPLQKALFNECRRLIDKTYKNLSDEHWKVLMLICQPKMLMKLDNNEQKGYQHFINNMNILTAIGLKYQ